MKSTMIQGTIANPRRTTLAHLDDADGLALGAVETAADLHLPAQTANPRRTVLMDVPDVG